MAYPPVAACQGSRAAALRAFHAEPIGLGRARLLNGITLGAGLAALEVGQPGRHYDVPDPGTQDVGIDFAALDQPTQQVAADVRAPAQLALREREASEAGNPYVFCQAAPQDVECV